MGETITTSPEHRLAGLRGAENGDKCAWITSGQGASRTSLSTGTFRCSLCAAMLQQRLRWLRAFLSLIMPWRGERRNTGGATGISGIFVFGNRSWPETGL